MPIIGYPWGSRLYRLDHFRLAIFFAKRSDRCANTGMAATLEFGFEDFRLGRVEKAEADRTFLGLNHVMQAMGLDDALHIVGLRNVAVV